MTTVSGSSGAACDSSDTRWRVSFAADLGARRLTFVDSVLLLRRDALRLVLLDEQGVTIDACCLRAAETLDIGDMVAFPCHFARIRDRLPAACLAPASSVDGVGGMGTNEICYVGRIILKTSGVVINVSKWSSAVGSKGVMEVAWVKISNVPLDKRSEINLAYVASLVGIPLETDTTTLHRPACARVKIGCRNIDDIPSVTESVLGGHFYDFYFEVDQVLVRNPNTEENNTNDVMSKDKKKLEDNDNDMSKKPKLDGSSNGLGEKLPSTTQIGEKQDQMQESQESMESDVSLHTSLLIDSMALDYMEEEKQGVITGVARGEAETRATIHKVESPDSSLGTEVIPTPPLATEENLRFGLRNVQSKMEKIQEKVVTAAKKRDIEGTTHIPNSFD
ncbi:hypothetical protein D1007_61383 [Hordeum vulgare]|nr:hypothetical protein D1007_61383 [Hordeum vulgare]